MKRIGYYSLASAVMVTAIAVAALAPAFAATPVVNGALLNLRVFNDCPTSLLTTTNTYPGVISITDANVSSGNFANRHNWRASADGGVTEASFDNNAAFRISANVTLSGTGRGEGGMQICPWWTQEVDGQFYINADPVGFGEIACFGGRLPFYSFTTSFGLHYTKGTTVFMEMTYSPNGLSSVSPATIDYVYRDGSGTYDSGPIAFDQGNPAEDPPHGLWGILNDARVGGYVMPKVMPTDGFSFTGTWEDIRYEPLGATPTQNTTWGKLKTLYK